MNDPNPPIVQQHPEIDTASADRAYADLVNMMRAQVDAAVEARVAALAQQNTTPAYPAHSPPSVADIGAFMAMSGVAAENVGPTIAKVQAKLVGAMVDVIQMITGEIQAANDARMRGFVSILQNMPAMVGYGGHRDALIRLMMADPNTINDSLLAARYSGTTDWRDSVPPRR